jgi:hypothetical protein
MRIGGWWAGLLAVFPAALLAQAPQGGARVEDAVWDEAAARAWGWMDRNYVAATGLVRATDHYDHVTTWDIGSALLGMHAARGLGLLEPREFDRRVRRALATLREMPLHDGAAFNRLYSARTARMTGRGDVETTSGSGWSATDLGRLLVALKVLASAHPELEGDADAVVRRLAMDRIVRDGYLWGEDVRGRRVSRYPEGRIGYEQYAAQGFALWGFRAERALDVTVNARPVQVEGVTLMADRRGGDRLTGEPFFLGAIEMDLWGEPLNVLSDGVLAAQEARWRRTGQPTMASEDAVPLPPYHFYYYNVYQAGGAFGIDAQAPMRGVRIPPWVSTKAAFAWHALRPSDHTRAALDLVVGGQREARDWGAGVFEGSAAPTGGANVNTASIILEAALYRRSGRRLLEEPGI